MMDEIWLFRNLW